MLCVCAYMYMCVCVCAYVSVCVCVYMCFIKVICFYFWNDGVDRSFILIFIFNYKIHLFIFYQNVKLFM